jgi:RNA polymerase sigma-70 factor (ECF subfamily)
VDQLRESTEVDVSSQFVEGLRSGSPEFFESFYERFFDRIHGFARHRVRNAAEADDLTQEIFLAVMRSIDAYRARADFESWVFGVARNVVREHFRSARRRQAREAVAQQAGAPPTPEEELSRRRIVETLSRRLAAAESWQAEAFALQCFERLPQTEIARRTERTRYAVGTSLKRLRRRIASDLGVLEPDPGWAAKARRRDARLARRSPRDRSQ